MSVKLLTEHNLEFLSLKGDCKCLSESTPVKIPHWKSHVAALLLYLEPVKIFLTACNINFFFHVLMDDVHISTAIASGVYNATKGFRSVI